MRLHESYVTMEEHLDQIENRIREDEYEPEGVVSVNRGGAFLGIELSHRFDIPHGVISLSHYDGDEIQDEGVEYEGDMLETVKDAENVLLVDDISDTGKTLENAYRQLEEEFEDVKTATSHIKPGTESEPDYFSQETNNWIVYPWEE